MCNELHYICELQENGQDQQEVEAIDVVDNISVVNRDGVVVENKPRTLVVRFETEKKIVKRCITYATSRESHDGIESQ